MFSSLLQYKTKRKENNERKTSGIFLLPELQTGARSKVAPVLTRVPKEWHSFTFYRSLCKALYSEVEKNLYIDSTISVMIGAPSHSELRTYSNLCHCTSRMYPTGYFLCGLCSRTHLSSFAPDEWGAGSGTDGLGTLGRASCAVPFHGRNEVKTRCLLLS